MLEVRDLTVFRGPVQAVRNVSFTAGQEIVGITGVNGAGKTSLIMGILGLLPHTGTVYFKGSEISKLPTHEISKLGIGYVPEDRRIYPYFTVDENIVLPLLPRKSSKIEINKILEEVYAIFPELKKMRARRGHTLSGGEQKMLSVARALAIRPSFLLLDEVLEGLAPLIRTRLHTTLTDLRKERNFGVLMTESDTRTLSKLARKIYKIERGIIQKE